MIRLYHSLYVISFVVSFAFISIGAYYFALTPGATDIHRFGNVFHSQSTSPLRANATFVTLARNSDVWDIARSIRDVEERFNHKFHYDWVFLNDEEFGDLFKEVTAEAVSGRARYGRVPEAHWSFPDSIEQEKAARVRAEMRAAKIAYGDSISYRHMCRFESGFFFWHELMLEYEWYWRVEPNVEYYCDIDYDVFCFMADEGKKYGFIIAMHEDHRTVPSLWRNVRSFVEEFPQHLAENNSMAFLSDDDGETYNYCHFWSNFEVGNLNWLRSRAYTDFFEHLDRAGGFFYERWGDAPIHSIAAGLLLQKDEVHYFDDIAYYHPPITHCPSDEKFRVDHHCVCTMDVNFVEPGDSCLRRFSDLHGLRGTGEHYGHGVNITDSVHG